MYLAVVWKNRCILECGICGSMIELDIVLAKSS